MEIARRLDGDVLVLELAGRLDARWSDHVAASIETALRDGRHQLRLDLAHVDYISSAGIRVLIRYSQQLRRIGGSFGISQPAQPVVEVLEMAGVLGLLEVAAPADRASGTSVERSFGRFELYPLTPGARARCQVVGDPSTFERGFTAADCQRIAYPEGSFGLGLGALGRSFADCQGRFGEFLAVAGSATYLPTDGTHTPDFLLAEQALVPELHVLYGARCQGDFAQLARFETDPELGAVPLSQLVVTSLELADAQAAGLVILADATGLLGAALRRSPVQAVGAPSLAFPEIRSWLSFTSERAFPNCLALVVGLAAREAPRGLEALLRPLGKSGLLGHFHAAAFSYRPLPQGRLELQETVRELFEEQTLQGLLHLLGDDRELVGVGESEFTRGACWIAPLGEVVTGGSS